jgi:hypothetical protein
VASQSGTVDPGAVLLGAAFVLGVAIGGAVAIRVLVLVTGPIAPGS